jgi:hypothetical protein
VHETIHQKQEVVNGGSDQGRKRRGVGGGKGYVGG